LLSAMTGSASGGMSIALDSLGTMFVHQAQTAGVSLQAMHRITSVASGSLDALPHNGAVITLLAVCGLSHRESYFDIFMTSMAAPLIALILMIVLATLFGSF
jgi:H+/gluconate symporter-like permease